MSKKLNVKGADPRLESLFDHFVSDWPSWPSEDAKTRDIWADRIRRAASQPGFKFDPALRRLLVYVLVGSKKYSLLTSVKKAQNYGSKEVSRLIIRVARAIGRGVSYDELKPSFDIGQEMYRNDDIRAGRAVAAACALAVNAANVSEDFIEISASAAVEASMKGEKYSFDTRPALYRSKSDYAAALLYFVEQEAYGRGKRRGNPASENVPSLEKLLGTRKASHNTLSRSANPNAAKKTAKKTAKRKAPLAKTLISKCQKAWDHYCASPSKKRLKEVFDHLEVMKESSAKTVKDERARCLRAANKEAKRLKMKK